MKKHNMPEKCCPNFDSCKLVNASLPDLSTDRKQEYIDTFCIAGPKIWESCKRYMCKNEIHFCPDFVFPDTGLTTEEIIDQFDYQ
jgi:hypothetical protein